MRLKIRSVLSGILIVSSVMMGGCVTQAEYSDMKQNYEDRLQQFKLTVKQLEAENNEIKNKYLTLKERKEKLKSKVNTLQGLRNQLQNKLEDFKKANPDVSFGKEGQLSLKGDVLFASGRAELKDDGKETLKKLADIMKEESAELRIVGHTDNEPITKSKHLWDTDTNMELGAHRALSVFLYLKEQGVNPKQMHIASYGPYDPRKPNNSTENKKLNRRVEIWVKRSASKNNKSEKSKSKSGSDKDGQSEDDLPPQKK